MLSTYVIRASKTAPVLLKVGLPGNEYVKLVLLLKVPILLLSGRLLSGRIHSALHQEPDPFDKNMKILNMHCLHAECTTFLERARNVNLI